MTETKRGRISHATYAHTIGLMLTRDWFALEECEVLTQLDIVKRLVSDYPSKYLTPGWAVRRVLDKAITRVIQASKASHDARIQKIATYLELRLQYQSTSDIAHQWGVSRECVSRTIGRQAILLVTDQVLAMNREKPDNSDSLKKEKGGIFTKSHE
jgi:hypothetical protein